MRRFITFFASLLLCAVVLAGQNPPVLAPDALRFVPRGQQALSEWEFSQDGCSWQSVNVPHCWNAADGHSASYRRGQGIYRTDISIRNAAARSYLIFEGAAQAAKVYVNDALACEHKGGYTAFAVNLSNRVHKGRNPVQVLCDNTEDLELIPVSSDFNKNGGLHNPVWLFQPAGVHFSPMHYGLYRMHVSQTSVSDTLACARVQAFVVGRAPVTLRVRDAAGRIVHRDTRTANGEYDVSFSLASPHLWQGLDDPYLYTVELCVGTDRAVAEIGFRWFSVSRDGGFFLNGRSYPLRGVCMHQDLDGKASALSYEDYDADYATVRELGCNFLRLAHYPHNDYAFRLCDHLGIVVQTEIPWVNVCGRRAAEAYFQNIHSQMREMITNLYNHPSIVFWGMWNELDRWGNKEELQGPLDEARVVSETARLYRYAKSLDAQRLVGLTDDSVFKRDGYTGLRADFYSENRYYGWYYNYGDFSGITGAMEKVRSMMGPANISEYGVGVNPFCHTWNEEDISRYPDDARHVEEYGNLFHESHAAQIARMPWLNFTSVWVLFDFPVASRMEGYMDSSDGITYTENPDRLYINDKGLVTRDRKTSKDTFYLYKAWWNRSEETVYIAGRRLLKRPAGREFTLTVYSNAPSLRLLQDGVAVGALNSSGEPTGVVWKFHGLSIPQGGSEFTVVSPSGRSDSVRFEAIVFARGRI
ncbi:MAG: hypothetical protein IJU68_08240 [Bacteroidales bacterium]|nr:hypothetical protein [Bacteroidales bacterium]